MSISQRALGVSDIPRDPTDRDRLREEWRLLALEWSKLEDQATRLEEAKKILMAVAIDHMVSGGLAVNRAENACRSSEEYKDHVSFMCDARRAANDAKIAMENADRIYWANINEEANARTERRLSR